MSHCPTPLNVGTMVNAPLCNSLYLFLSFSFVLKHTNNHCHPYIDSTTVLSDIWNDDHALRIGMHAIAIMLQLVGCPTFTDCLLLATVA